MKLAVLGLIVSIVILFSGKPTVEQAIADNTVQPQVTPVVVQPIIPRPIRYLQPCPALAISPLQSIYIYRNPITRTYVPVRKYRFPILGRLLRTHIDIHGPDGRGIHLGVGQHPHN